MTPELAAVAATALIHFVAVGWSQKSLETDIGHEANVGTRENLDARLSAKTLRLRRALANHVENSALFLSAVVLIELTGNHSALTALCAWVYVAARALYLPAYAFGWVPWRTYIFGIGALATAIIILASLF